MDHGKEKEERRSFLPPAFFARKFHRERDVWKRGRHYEVSRTSRARKVKINLVSTVSLACEQALLFGRAKRAARERASERRSREGPAKGELATIPFKFSFVLRLDEGKYHWLKNDVPEIKVD